MCGLSAVCCGARSGNGGRRTTAATMVGVCFFFPSFRLTNCVSGASQPQNHSKTNHQSHQISLYCDSTWYNVHTYIRAELLSLRRQKTAFRPYSFFANVKEPRSNKEIDHLFKIIINRKCFLLFCLLDIGSHQDGQRPES